MPPKRAGSRDLIIFIPFHVISWHFIGIRFRFPTAVGLASERVLVAAGLARCGRGVEDVTETRQGHEASTSCLPGRDLKPLKLVFEALIVPIQGAGAQMGSVATKP